MAGGGWWVSPVPGGEGAAAFPGNLRNAVGGIEISAHLPTACRCRISGRSSTKFHGNIFFYFLARILFLRHFSQFNILK